MNWKEAESLIRQHIVFGFRLDNRIVLEGPDYKCRGYNYNGAPGFKIKIGTNTVIEIPFIMLQSVYSVSIANNRTYDNQVFKSKYGIQYKSHGCHVHVIGRLFEKAGVVNQIDKRRYTVL
jgi:hypothetical protein